jgi:hypothetical protein
MVAVAAAAVECAVSLALLRRTKFRASNIIICHIWLYTKASMAPATREWNT